MFLQHSILLFLQLVYPFTGDHKQKFYWGHGEVFISVYKSMDDAMKKHPTADVLVNFASLRSAYESTLEAMNYPQIRTIAIIAEGIPENMTRKLNKLANEKHVSIIGPATVSGMQLIHLATSIIIINFLFRLVVLNQVV